MQEKVVVSFLLIFFLVTIFKISEIPIDNIFKTPFLNTSWAPPFNRPIVILHWNRAYDKYLFLNEDLEQCPDDHWKKCHVITDRRKAIGTYPTQIEILLHLPK